MDLQAFKAPVGSLIVDGALVIALVVWGTSVTNALDNINLRVSKTEVTLEERQSALQRLAIAETEIAAVKKNHDELKADIIKRLDRIENKLDRR